jgi:hypothetical protein
MAARPGEQKNLKVEIYEKSHKTKLKSGLFCDTITKYEKFSYFLLQEGVKR